MKTYTQDELQEILHKHGLWLAGAEGCEHANLSDANLRRCDLRDIDLRGADLRYADLSGADLRGAKLSGCNLGGARTDSPIVQFNGPKHQAIYCQGYVRIGCQYHSLEHWLRHYEAIGKAAEYTEDQIAVYGGWLNSLRYLL